MPPSVVLVTGVSRFLGGRLAARLAADPSIDRVLGVDTASPSRDLRARMGRVEFVRADVRNPLIARVVTGAEVDTVVHAALSPDPAASGAAGREANVLGTMQLLAAVQKAPSVRRVVLESTTAVYGTSPLDPAVVDETAPPNDLPAHGRDATEIEGYLRGFARRRDDVAVTVLRFASVVGPRIDTALTRWFALPVVPTVLGFDARLQLLHEEDALAVLTRAVTRDRSGVFNVAADGVLLLSQALRRAGRLRLPVPEVAVGPAARLLGAGRVVAPLEPPLGLGRVVDTARLRDEFGFTPRWTTVQAFDDFVHGHALTPVLGRARVDAGLAVVDRGLHAAARVLTGVTRGRA